MDMPDRFHVGDDPPRELRCWPFVHHCFEKMGVILDYDIHKAAKQFHAVPAGLLLHPMDIVFIARHTFGERHVGILEEPHRMFHCNEAQNGVSRTELTRPGWKDLKKQYYRFDLFDYENLCH